MWYEFENISYVTGGTAMEADNTDWSLSGTSKKFTFTAVDDTVTISFDAVDVTSYDEISMQIYSSPLLDWEDILEIDIDGNTYSFDEMTNEFHHVLFDTEGLTALSEIIFRGKAAGLVIFVDLAGYRKVSDGQSIEDVMSALADTLSFNYNVTTTLSADVSAGAMSISITNNIYMRENTVLLIDDAEEVTLNDSSGNLKQAIIGSYSSGDSVSIQVPVKWGKHKTIDNDPVCGIVLYDIDNLRREYVMQIMRQGYKKQKVFLHEIYLAIYLETHSEKKLFELIDQYEFNYGEQFNFILDGEQVELISINRGTLLINTLDAFPRMTYRYSFKPQPLTIKTRKQITTQTLTLELGEPA